MMNDEQSKRSTPERVAEIALIERLRLGEQDTWQQFIGDWSPHLYNYLKARVPTTEAAEDLLHETLMGLVQAIRNFDSNTSLSTLVYSIAFRKVADYWRRQRDRSWEQISPEEANAVGLAMQSGLNELPEQYQHALLMRYHRGYSIDEIAHELGRSYKGTISLLQRARRSLGVSMSDTGVSSKRQAPLITILQMLLTQQQKCLNLKMNKEVLIFQRAIRLLHYLTATYTIGETP